MRNCEIHTSGKVLTITVDLSKPGTESASGKSVVIGSTQGNQAVAGPGGKQFQVGVNVYTRK